MARNAVPARKPDTNAARPNQAPDETLGMDVIARPLRQLGSDVKSGSRQLGDLFQASVQRVKSNFQKLKDFTQK